MSQFALQLQQPLKQIFWCVYIILVIHGFIPASLSLVLCFCRKEKGQLQFLSLNLYSTASEIACYLSLGSSILKPVAFPVGGRLLLITDLSAQGRAVKSSSVVVSARANRVREVAGLLMCFSSVMTELAIRPPQGW